MTLILWPSEFSAFAVPLTCGKTIVKHLSLSPHWNFRRLFILPPVRMRSHFDIEIPFIRLSSVTLGYCVKWLNQSLILFHRPIFVVFIQNWMPLRTGWLISLNVDRRIVNNGHFASLSPSFRIALKELRVGVRCLNVWNFAQGLKFKTDFHSKMSVCRHELGGVELPQPYPGNSNTALGVLSTTRGQVVFLPPDRRLLYTITPPTLFMSDWYAV